MGQGKCSQDPLLLSHNVAPEPGGDDDLALAHPLVMHSAPPAPKRLLDQGGKLDHALLALPLQVKELGTARVSAGAPSGDRDPRPGATSGGCGIAQEPPGWARGCRRGRGTRGAGTRSEKVRPCPTWQPNCPTAGSPPCPRSPFPGLTLRGERMKILVWPNASSSAGNARSASSTSAPSLHRGGRRGRSQPRSPWTGEGAARRAHVLS